VGDSVEADDVLGRVFAASESAAREAERGLRHALSFASDERPAPELIHDVIRPAEPARR
jgi:hypothetical protein